MATLVLRAACAIATLCVSSIPVLAQRDPGIRGGFQNTAGMLQYRGIPIPPPPVISPHPATGATITANELASFKEGILRAGQLESTCDECAMVTEGTPVTGRGELDPTFPQFTTNSNGLGARHNADQCFGCHAQPTLGGSGGFLVPNPGPQGQFTPLQPENPMFRLFPFRFGKRNVVPSFQLQFGPIREVRFINQVDQQGNIIRDSDGNPISDGGVKQLWVVKGISNDPTIPRCNLSQPDFEKQVANRNVAFRIPLQMLGLGLIESIQDREVLARFNATASQRRGLGIGGRPNRSGNNGTITRFGWKAQNMSITMFAGEAYSVEMGISNELFPIATEEDPDCQGPAKPEPNDVTRMASDDRENQAFKNPVHILADWMQFQLLMRFTDGPKPDPSPSASAVRGQMVFSNIGCALCHTPQMQTAAAMNSAVLQNRPVRLFSDLMLHRMGPGLADGIAQGQAGPDEFRTTPLWGVGQRMFLLHDGRTSDLLEAINAHASPSSGRYPASEANGVIQQFPGTPGVGQTGDPGFPALPLICVAGGFRRQPDFDETMILAAPFTLGLKCSSYACAIGVALAAHLYAAGAMAESNAAPAHMRLVQSALDKPSVIVLGTVVGATTRIALCQIEGTREVIRLKVGETYDGWTLRDVDNRQARFEKFEVLTVLLIQSPALVPVAAKTASDPPPSPQPARRRKR